MNKVDILFFILFGLFGLIAIEFLWIQFTSEQPSKQHIFCEECCWYWKQTNTKLFTCAETKEELWRHVP